MIVVKKNTLVFDAALSQEDMPGPHLTGTRVLGPGDRFAVHDGFVLWPHLGHWAHACYMHVVVRNVTFRHAFIIADEK